MASFNLQNRSNTLEHNSYRTSVKYGTPEYSLSQLFKNPKIVYGLNHGIF